MARIDIDGCSYEVRDGNNLLSTCLIARPESALFLLAPCAGFGGCLSAMRSHPV